LNSYLYYENATCSGDTYIKGTVVYEYDDSSIMNTDGFVVYDYNGPCNYFDGGSYNLRNGRAVDDIYMLEGYCMECNGAVGCSPVEGTCDEFYTIAPWNETYYEDSAGGNNGYVIGTAKSIQQIIYQQLGNQSKIPIHNLIVGAIAMIGLLTLLSGSISAVRTLQESNIDFCNDGEEDESVNTDYESNNLVPSFMVV